MDIDEALIQGVRSWIFAATALAKTKIIPADDPNARPALPYIEVSLIQFDEQIGVDELEQSTTTAGNPAVVARGMRRATVSLQGYGTGSAQLIMKAALRLRNPSIMDLMLTNNFHVRDLSPITDVSALASNEIEKRFAKDFELQYLLRDTDPEDLIEPTTFVFAMTYDSIEIADLVDTLTITC
jgi:hypothetical protein